MRDSVETMATNSAIVSTIGICEITVVVSTSRISCGLTLPLLARPSVRISSMVSTMVNSTSRLAPAKRASSRRMEEWNNI